MDEQFLRVTKKELFYTAVMLGIKQLVNVVYDFPADEVLFDKELDEARKSLKKKKLLTESALDGVELDFTLMACALFCAVPNDCQVIDNKSYHATIYRIAEAYMLMEKRTEEDLAAVWFTDRDIIDHYVEHRSNAADGSHNEGEMEAATNG